MDQPLIARAWRRPAFVAALLGLLGFLVLAVVLFHGRGTAFDSWAFRVLPEHIPASRTTFLLGFTDPSLSVLMLALIIVLALSFGRPALAALAVIGPALGTVLASDVLKPFIHRTLFGGTVGSFPSGHETGVACTATVLLVSTGQLPLRRLGRCAVAAVLALWVVVAAVALTRSYYHHATDTIGAIGLSVALVLGLAGLLDRFWPDSRRRAARPPRSAAIARPARPARADRPARPRPARRPRPVPVDEPAGQLTPRA